MTNEYIMRYVFSFLLYLPFFITRIVVCFIKGFFQALGEVFVVFTSAIGIFLWLYRIILFPFLFIIDFFTAFYIAYKICQGVAEEEISVQEAFCDCIFVP